MAACAHGAKLGNCPPAKVAREFNRADRGRQLSRLPGHIAEMKKHGLHK